MPGISQQRSGVSRRTLTRNNPSRPLDLVMELSQTAPTKLLLSPTENQGQCVLTGTPRVINQRNGEVAAAVQPMGLNFELTFPSGIIATDVFALAASDPAIRTAQGGYVAPFISALAASIPTPQPFQITNAFIVGNDVNLPTDATTEGVFVRLGATVSNTTQGTTAVEVSSSGDTLRATFTTPAIVGDVIEIMDDDPGMCTGNGGKSQHSTAVAQ